jgi:prepilin-type N-terminal cleavage/methylation domain-containing protein
MRARAAGFTLIELLIVIGILGALAAVIVPLLADSRGAADVALDEMQLRQSHALWLTNYARQHNGALPPHGGHQFVLATWKDVDQTAESLDRYFTPGARDNDPRYQDLRLRLLRGEKIWQDLEQCTADDTTYCGRAKEHLKTATLSGNEAWMANSNHDMWTLRNGTVNILLCGLQVRSLSYPMLEQLYGLPPFDPEKPIATWGLASPIDVCRKLDR